MQTSPAQTRPTSPTPPAPPVAPTLAPSLTWFSTALIVVCGILLPATTLLVEALTHMCADGFFDPLPTVGHVFAIAAVPLAGVVSLWVLKRRDAARIEAVIFAQAFAVAISGVYAVIFAPMTPVAAFGVMLWGPRPAAAVAPVVADRWAAGADRAAPIAARRRSASASRDRWAGWRRVSAC